MFKAFKEEIPEAGRSVLAVWFDSDGIDELYGPDEPGKKANRFGYAGVYSFGKEAFGLRLFRGDCRSETHAGRIEADLLATNGRWVYLSDLIALGLASPDMAIMVEGGIDETNPWIYGGSNGEAS